MKSLKLNTGYELPMIGFGTYRILPEDCERVIHDAAEVGYRLFDTAPQYFNEEQIGNGIFQCGVPRDELFITSKIWFTMFENDDPRRSVERSLKNMHTDYLDLVLVHWPFGNYYNAWRQMEKMQEEGLIRSIGVSNFTAAQLVDLIQYNKLTPAVNQIDTTLITQQHEIHRWMEKYGVTHQAFAPFGQDRANEMFELPQLKAIALAHDKTTRQIALRFTVQRGIPVVPKSTKKERMQQNLDVLNFSLTEEEMAVLYTLDTGKSLISNAGDPNCVEASQTWRKK